VGELENINELAELLLSRCDLPLVNLLSKRLRDGLGDPGEVRDVKALDSLRIDLSSDSSPRRDDGDEVAGSLAAVSTLCEAFMVEMGDLKFVKALKTSRSRVGVALPVAAFATKEERAAWLSDLPRLLVGLPDAVA
jgi:hypothetical protein